MEILSQSVQGYLKNSSWIRRMFELGTSLKKKHGNENVFDFSLGNPDLPAPQEVGNALSLFANNAQMPFAFGYMPNGGFLSLRNMLAEYLSLEQKICLTGEDVILSCGAAGAINAFFRAVLNPGDEVLTTAPYFVEYGFYCENHAAKLKTTPALQDTFMLDIDSIEKAISKNTRVVLINSPHNPTGAVYPERDLQALANLLENKSQQYGKPIWLAADEPYRFLAYDDIEVPSVLPLYDYAVVISSFSKNMSLPGERLGYLACAPSLPEKESLMSAITLTNRILGYVNPPVIGQKILEKALGAKVDISVYGKRRLAMAEVLNNAGYEYQMPSGAFYFFPKAPGGNDIDFVNLLLEERILAVPGTGFGCPGYFRLAFCVNENVILNAKNGFKQAYDKAIAN